ncbi:hypothetical protein PAXRUDRAFT_149770, partial [Paxillus rubicundulus Ve08.2h10]
KKGLQKLQDQMHDRKVQLKAELKANRPISKVDEEWLDYTGNLVDEEHVLEVLDKASDYEAVLEMLNQQEKSIVQKLTELAGEQTIFLKKQKCMALKFSVFKT